MNGLLVQRDLDFSAIEKIYPGQRLNAADMNDRKQRREAVEDKFDRAWLAALNDLEALCLKIRQGQPHLQLLTAESINKGPGFPEALAFGRLRLSYHNFKRHLPRLLPFPFQNAFRAPDTDEGHRLIHQLLLRLMHALPVGRLEITAADPLKMGNSLEPFKPLLAAKRLFPKAAILTSSNEMGKALEEMRIDVTDRLQNRFTGEIKNWSDYNARHPDSPLPYKVLLVFGVPEELREDSQVNLRRLLEHGPSCGLLPILTVKEEKEKPNARKFSETDLYAAIIEFSRELGSLAAAAPPAGPAPKITIEERPESWPEPRRLREFLALLAEKYQSSTRPLTDLWAGEPALGRSSAKGLTVPIGWATEDGEAVPFSLGKEIPPHHALMGGQTGTGKSNLLHVIIHSLCHYYPPSELNLYLLDYKGGTEFSVYAKPYLPQAKLVTKQSDPAYGVTVLAHLEAEMKERAEAFKDLGESENVHISEFQRYRDYLELPRILLIIDEFQNIFQPSPGGAGEAANSLTNIVRQGRAFGIHVLLATQTLKGLTSAMTGWGSLLDSRIALRCGPDDSTAILGSRNEDAARLSSPPEGIINNDNGDKDRNHIFLIPKADAGLCRDHLSEIIRAARDSGHCYHPKVFDGSKLPERPAAGWFKDHSGPGVRVRLGKRLNFQEDDFFVDFKNRPSHNLLAAVNDEGSRDGLIESILHSLPGSDSLDEIIHCAAGDSPPPPGAESRAGGNKPILKRTDLAGLDLAYICDTMDEKKKVVIIEQFDSARELFVPPPQKHGETTSQKPELLKRILDDGPKKGTFVIAFVDDWKRLSGKPVTNSNLKEILIFFDLRIGFGLNEEDAGSLLFGQTNPLKGVDTGNCAVFHDRNSPKPVVFRPYA